MNLAGLLGVVATCTAGVEGCNLVPCGDARPFLKYPGGKTQLLPELLQRVPPSFKNYHEPFVGGGALFFALAAAADEGAHQFFLSDLNEELMVTYGALRDNVVTYDVVRELKAHAENHRPEYYKAIRAASPRRPFEVAARMIYLNKTCFNGLYRVNKAGRFNVPMGKQAASRVICDKENLMRVAWTLNSNVHLDWATYDVVERAQAGDFVYFDPPYVPASATANFTAYTADGFGYEDQLKLRNLVLSLKLRGVHVMVSNSINAWDMYNHPDLKVEVVQARRSVNSKGGKRGPVEEIIVT